MAGKEANQDPRSRLDGRVRPQSRRDDGERLRGSRGGHAHVSMFGYILILIMVLGAAGLGAVVWTYMKAQGIIGGKPHRRHRRRTGGPHSH